MARIVLGVAGGIAAYKSAVLLRLLREHGHSVRVVPTGAALQFVGKATWEALSGEPVTTSVFEQVDEVAHVRIGHEADLVVVAPATADVLASARAGLAGDLLTATLLTTAAPVLMAPAMHTEMWHHAATRENVRVLRDRGVHVLDPAEGRLTGSDSGPGRLPEPEEIFAAVQQLLAPPGEPAPGLLQGKRVLVSAGGTREPLDPVRFLGNRSSGRQGTAMAAAALAAGARVTLVAANVERDVLREAGLGAPGSAAGLEVVGVESALELRETMLQLAVEADIVVMAAAVADYRPASLAETKLKKQGDDGLTLQLVQNPDILRDLVAQRAAGTAPAGQRIVGFAAETGDEHGTVLEYGSAKLLRKGADFLVVNEVGAGRGFGTAENSVTLVAARDGSAEVIGERRGSKADVSQWVLSRVVTSGPSR